jgi:hypothetical protein
MFQGAGRLGPVVVVLAFCGSLVSPSLSAGRDDAATDLDIAAPVAAEQGVWRTKVQSVFDPDTRTLVRRAYVIWDSAPSRDLDFVWIPDSRLTDREGKVNGGGRVIWRFKGRPAYDRSAVFAEYRGWMRDGQTDGHGSYRDITGASYEGDWQRGQMEGRGRLRLPGGDEYVGQMRGGKADGLGRYTDVTGEIFEGRFAAGKRVGTGKTTLPNGTSYASEWVMGVETEHSRSLRVAQSNGSQSTNVSDDIRIGITVDRTKARDYDLVYTASSEGPKLVIKPENPRLMDMWKGNGEIQLSSVEEGLGILSFARGNLLPLSLVLEVQNRSNHPIEVAGAYLDVASSVADLQPAIQLRQLDSTLHPSTVCTLAGFQPYFRAENFGWSAAERPALRFAFTQPNVNLQPEALTIIKNLRNIDRTIDLDLEPELRAAGVNVAAVKARAETGFTCTSKAPSECLQQIRGTGVFGSLAPQISLDEITIRVTATGVLDYVWHDHNGAEHKRSSPYRLNLPLGHVHIEAECGEGGETDLIASKPISFKLDQNNYRLPLSFQRNIPAGRTSRFTITVDAKKASDHEFTVVLQLADGREIASRPASLIYYLPSWFRAQ